MARDKGRRPGGRPPTRPVQTIDLRATEVTTDFAASETDRKPDDFETVPPTESAPAATPDDAAAAFAASESDRAPEAGESPPEAPAAAPAESAAEPPAPEADRGLDELAPAQAADAKPPQDGETPAERTDCWPAVPDQEADVSPATGTTTGAAVPPAAAVAAAEEPKRRPAPEPEAPSVDPKVFDRPRRGMGRDEYRDTPEKRGGGGFLPGLLGGAVAGGLVAFGVVASGIVPRPGPDATDEQRIAGIEASIRSLVESRAQPPAADAALGQRVAAAETAIRALEQRPAPSAPAAPAVDPALADRVAAAEAAARQAGQQVAAVEAEVRRLGEAVRAAPAEAPAPDTTRLDALGTELGTLRTEVQRIAEQLRAAPTDPAERLAALQQGQTALQQGLTALQQGQTALQQAQAASQQGQTALGQRLAALDGRLDEADRRLAEVSRQAQDLGASSKQLAERASALDGRLAEATKAREALAQQVSRLSEQESAPDADREARLLLALNALDASIAAGRSYRAELEAVKRLVADPAVLAPLEQTADSGLPTVAVLARRARAELAALPPPAGSEPTPSGVLERLAAGARSLVKVTPAGEGAAAIDPEDARARFVASLEAGDLAAAGAAFAAMGQAGQQAVADIELAAAARRAATGILAGIRADTIAALGSPS